MTKKHLSDFPDLVKEYLQEMNGYSPERLGYCSQKKVWWKCPRGHVYETTVAHRARENKGCPVCANRRVLPGYNDLASHRPDLLAEWDYKRNKGEISPEKVTEFSNKSAWWICPNCGHHYFTSISNRTAHKTGCPECRYIRSVQTRRKTRFSEHNTLADLRPDLLQFWDYERNIGVYPTELGASSGKSVWWRCTKCKKSFQAQCANRKRAVHPGLCRGCAVKERTKKG